MKAFFVLRKLTAANGTSILHPIGLAANESIVKDMAAQAEGFQQEIAAGKIVVQTPDGPRAVMSVAQLLVELGIQEMGVVTMSGECKESALVVPRNLVSLQ